MNITGFDYEVLSNASFDIVENRFIASLHSIWDNPVMNIVEDIEDEKRWLFFAENETMLKKDDGYELNEKEEGCFSIIGVKQPIFNEVCGFINAERQISGEIRILQTHVWSYTVVLPALIEENLFSKKIYDLFINALLQDASPIIQNKFDQRPYQSYIGH